MLSSGNWVAKDTAIYLVTALAVKSTTAAAGATATNEVSYQISVKKSINIFQLVPIVDFCRSQIIPELSKPTSQTPILKATCVKFVTTFRQLLPTDMYTAIFPLMIQLVRDSNYVIHSYAATCVERMLTVRDGANLRLGSTAEYVTPLLTNLFATLSSKDSQENEYVMKGILPLPYLTRC